MVTFEATVDIDRPIEEVFAYVTDLTHVPEWAPSIQKVQVDGPPRVGAKAMQTHSFMGRVKEVPSEITEYEPNRRFGFAAKPPFSAVHVINFTPQDGGTRLHGHFEADFGVPGALQRVFLAAAKKEYDRDYLRLKHILESTDRPVPEAPAAEAVDAAGTAIKRNSGQR